jgi:hypothetical protein
MHRPLFLRILRAVQQEDDYFTIRCDATGLAGLGPLQKVCAAFAYPCVRVTNRCGQ